MDLHVNLVDIVLKMLWSAFLGGMIGFERSISRKPAGMRTYILISMGACLFTALSVLIFKQYPENMDLGRIAGQIVMGVGFIGAGAIMRSGTSVGGLTTAASIWVVAAIGTFVGFGLFQEAGVAGVFVFITLLLLTPLEKRLVARVHDLREKRQNKK